MDFLIYFIIYIFLFIRGGDVMEMCGNLDL